jgi:hypothetical protein
MKKTLKIKNGNSDDAIKQLGSLDKSSDYRVTIELWDYKRSISQNKRYWDLLGAISNHLGYNTSELHSLMAYKYLSYKNSILDHEVTVIPSTTTLTIKEFSKYMGDIESFAKGLGFERKVDFQDFQDG